MPIYKYIIFDVDDTLLDFYPAFVTAQRNIADKLGINPSEKYLESKIEECLMVGDSITNDIAGAKAIGMAVCYYNPKGKRKPENVLVDYEIRYIHDLVQILL